MKRREVTIVLFLLLMILGQVSAAELTGTVREEGSDVVISGATLEVVGGGPNAVTDSSGLYCLSGLEPGRVMIMVRHVGYHPQTKLLTITQDGINWNIQMQSAAIGLDEVVITASREPQSLLTIPAAATVLSSSELVSRSHFTTDEVIQGEPGVTVLREGGMFTVAPTLVIRGTGADEPGRTVVLVDGAPVNKQDTGGVNWNRLAWLETGSIEILRGALSAVYGSGAMGGVVQLFSPVAREGINVSGEVHGGTFGTVGGSASIRRGFHLADDQSLEFSLRMGGRQSDGYISTLEEDRNEFTVKNFLKEKALSVGLALHGPAASIRVAYDYYDDLRGEGEKILAPDGETRTFATNALRVSASGGSSSLTWNVASWGQFEQYTRVDERIKNEMYERFDVLSDRMDVGGNGEFTIQTEHLGRWTAGLEVSRGAVDGEDHYITSPDYVINRGTLDIAAATLRTRQSALDGRVKLIASLRYDHAMLHDGEILSSLSPWDAIAGPLTDSKWQAISPAAGASLQVGSNVLFASYSRGFRAPTLDDLTRSGWTRIGPKLANPELGPETIQGVDVGIRGSLAGVRYEAVGYVSRGNDFLSYVDTGEEIFGGRYTLKQRKNIAEVSLVGAEYSLAATLPFSLELRLAATIRHSEIVSEPSNPELEGRKLEMSPEECGRADLTWRGPVDLTVTWEGLGEQYYVNGSEDVKIAGYGQFHMRASRRLGSGLELSLDGQNLTDQKYLGSVTQLAPGRMFLLRLGWSMERN